MAERVIEITNSDEGDSFINNNNLCVIFYGSERCPHCRTMVPVYDNLAKKYKTIAFGHVETSKVKVNNLNGVPVFVGYKNQEPFDSVIGADPESLNEMIEMMLHK